MSVRLVEHGLMAGFGALDVAVSAKTGTTGFPGPLNQKWSLYLEVAGIAAGLWGSKVGVPAEIRTSVAAGAFTMLGARAARYAMAGNLLKPGSWAGMGGDALGGDGDSGNAMQLGSGGAAPGPVLKIRGGVGGYPTYPPTSEAPGIAG